MGKKTSRLWNDSMSSSLISHTEHKYGAKLDEGPLSSALLISPETASKVKQATLIHQCTDCDYKTTVKGHLERHLRHHSGKSAHQCPRCSFSVSSMPRLANHVKHYHIQTDKKAIATEKQVLAIYCVFKRI